MFDLAQILKSYASEVGGQFNSHSAHEMVVIIPVASHRFQTVHVKVRQAHKRPLISFTSKICPATDELDYQALLENVQHFSYSRLCIHDGYLQVESLISVTTPPPLDTLKLMIQEVADIADLYEKKLTGKDIQ